MRLRLELEGAKNKWIPHLQIICKSYENHASFVIMPSMWNTGISIIDRSNEFNSCENEKQFQRCTMAFIIDSY